MRKNSKPKPTLKSLAAAYAKADRECDALYKAYVKSANALPKEYEAADRKYSRSADRQEAAEGRLLRYARKNF